MNRRNFLKAAARIGTAILASPLAVLVPASVKRPYEMYFSREWEAYIEKDLSWEQPAGGEHYTYTVWCTFQTTNEAMYGKRSSGHFVLTQGDK